MLPIRRPLPILLQAVRSNSSNLNFPTQCSDTQRENSILFFFLKYILGPIITASTWWTHTGSESTSTASTQGTVSVIKKATTTKQYQIFQLDFASRSYPSFGVLQVARMRQAGTVDFLSCKDSGAKNAEQAFL